MSLRCRRCKQTYVSATVAERVVWMAVEPWQTTLCATACEIEERVIGSGHGPESRC
jgi:hypothetical protein